jgi:hypothetical protein
MHRADSLSHGGDGVDPRLRARGCVADSTRRGPDLHGEADAGAGGLISSEAAVLWRGIGIYGARGPLRLAGPMHRVTSYETQAECEAAQQAATAKEALSRVAPTTEQLSDGIKT